LRNNPGNSLALMVQGTTSDAGKSTLAAGLCRVLKRRQQSVAPFKPQNMALNSAVTHDGGEIGRAQAVQAVAAGIPAHSDMNPVLIKPASDTGAQIIIQGRVNSQMTAQNFHRFKPQAMDYVLQSWRRLKAQYQTLIVEGAGSPAEINLRKGDIANMGFAEAVNCPVVLIADINPGGVFAHIVGTLALLSESEQARIKGFVINRFRGDLALLQPGLDWLEQKTGKPVFGVLPYLHHFHIEAEDAINTQQSDTTDTSFRIAVPVLPRISNHTDFDALRHHPDVSLTFVDLADTPQADLIILPGSKHVRADLAALRAQGWEQKLNRHLRYGGKVMGICGGYQMLGHVIEDPQGVEGTPGSDSGFGWLPLSTTMTDDKQLKNVSGELHLADSCAAFSGYEIHQGRTKIFQGQGQAPNTAVSNDHSPQPICFNDQRFDGCISSDNQVFGSYVHGLLNQPDACNLILQWAGLASKQAVDMDQLLNQQLDRLADTLEQHVNIDQLLEACRAC